MTLKKYLGYIGLSGPNALLMRRKLLLAAADAAEQFYAAEVLDKVSDSWAKAGLPEDLKMDLWESAGEDNDDRNRIAITVLTDDIGLAIKAVKVFAGSDYGKDDDYGAHRTAVWGAPAFTWGPADGCSHFRKVMDAVAEMAGPYADTRTSIREIREWVAGVRKSTERLFK